ncbi:uncharacterized protein LOC130894360 [Diorhabda carinulata]|uniref:uncharacterized protein LOC130894360 n=1 Tax=Diorhabda carinulata TaxID=1163345 RepID=UPI0025A2098E|nr:uncharacterized protein LOC130894360 [Diorhabda carinulata]
MYFSTTITIIFLIGFQFVVSIPETDNEHEIIRGNCSDPDENNLVYHNHVEKSAIPFIKRDATVEYHGDIPIYCISATSDSVDSVIKIEEGGIDHNYVTMQITSGRGKSLDYYVYIYAKAK